MIKPARLGSSVGMPSCTAPRSRRSWRRRSRGASATTTWCSPRPTWPAPASSRWPCSATAWRGSRGVRAGRDLPRSRVLRLRGQVRRRRLAHQRASPELGERAARRTSASMAAAAFLAIGASGFARVDFLVHGRARLPVGDQHHPGLHADQPLPALCEAGGYDFGALARASSSSRSSATRRARMRPSGARPCRDRCPCAVPPPLQAGRGGTPRRASSARRSADRVGGVAGPPGGPRRARRAVRLAGLRPGCVGRGAGRRALRGCRDRDHGARP